MAADVNNYYIGKGIVSFKKDGEMSFRDVGNVPEFEFTPEIEELEHFSSREGVRSNDRTIVLSRSAQVRMVMEEWTLENLAIALLGEVVPGEPWRYEVFSANAVEGELKFVGTNEVGRTYELALNSVTFLPGAALQFISEEWGRIEVTGRCATVGGSFGTLTDLEEASSGSG